MMLRITLRTALIAVLAAVLAAAFTGCALAQYSGGGTGAGAGGTASGGVYTPPKGGYKSSTGIAIGAGVAAGAALAYFALRHRGAVGCVESAGNHTTLVMAKNNKSYDLDAAGLGLKPGDKVKLKGKRSASGSGETTFTATKLVKDYGPCESQAAMSQSPTAP